jgi:hypothetical protein
MPPVFGMMFGLALLNLYAAWIGTMERRREAGRDPARATTSSASSRRRMGHPAVLLRRAAVRWGLATAGYMALGRVAVRHARDHRRERRAGVASAIVDNIPIMYAVLRMEPPMDLSQWLLITLTTGVGGSLLAVGSAAGVALMGFRAGTTRS